MMHSLRFSCLLLSLLFLPAASAQTNPSTRLITNIEYGVAPTPAGKESLKLDIRLPAPPATATPPAAAPSPIIILIHGGGWSGGDKNKDITPLFEPLANAGFLTFSINYRLAPANRWPACLEDVNTAIKWVKSHAAEYQGDPARIALLGHSAGGHLAFLAATLADKDTRVQAIVGCAPVTDHEQDLPVRGGLSTSLQNLLNRPKELTDESRKILREISPINHLKSDLPPFLILQGDADKTVPLQQSLNFQAKAKENSDRCDLITLKGAPHAILDWDKFDPEYKPKLVEWLKVNLEHPAAAATSSTTPPK